MPTYEYWCESCQHRTSVVKAMKDHSETEKCEKCGQLVEQVANATTFHLGEGAWASNRYTGKSNVRWHGDDK